MSQLLETLTANDWYIFLSVYTTWVLLVGAALATIWGKTDDIEGKIVFTSITGMVLVILTGLVFFAGMLPLLAAG